MAFQIVQSPETCLAGGALVGLFLTVRQQVALKVVVSCEVRGAVRALVTFRGWRLGIVLTVAWKTHLARRSTWIIRRHRSWKGEGAIPWIVRIRRNQLVLMVVVLMVVRLMLRSLVRTIVLSRMSRGPCGCFNGRCGRRSCALSVAKAGETDGARLHVVARNSSEFRNNDRRLCSLLRLWYHPRL